jgi:hypothetical protein
MKKTTRTHRPMTLAARDLKSVRGGLAIEGTDSYGTVTEDTTEEKRRCDFTVGNITSIKLPERQGTQAGSPTPSKVSTPKPAQLLAGSKASSGSVSPRTPQPRRSVLSCVDSSPVPNSVPGSKPS